MAKVQIERELCTGAGDCARSVPDVFWMGADGLAMVKEDASHFTDASQFDDDGAAVTSWARVPDSLIVAVDDAAAACPGMCIVVEHDAAPAEPEATPEPAAVVDEAPAVQPPRSSIGKRILYRLRHPAG